MSKYKYPGATNYNQQKLPAWKPYWEPKTVFLAFLAIGTVFIPIGIGLLLASNNVFEIVLDYTDCRRISSGGDLNGSPAFLTCSRYLSSSRSRHGPSCSCLVEFELPMGINGKVTVFYSLSRFWQNHRRLVKSRDNAQLLGYVGDVSSECYPYQYSNGSKIVPCGAFANSMFNDTIHLLHDGLPVPLLRTGIAWSIEKALYSNPPGKTLNESHADFVKPPNWSRNIWDLDPETPFNNGVENEDFIVWMRPAAFPNFRKIHRRVDHSHEVFRAGLPPGNYSFLVDYNFPVLPYGGRKFLILSNSSAFGGKNPFLGIIYIVTGSLVIVTAVVLFVIHKRCGIREEDYMHIKKTEPFFR